MIAYLHSPAYVVWLGESDLWVCRPTGLQGCSNQNSGVVALRSGGVWCHSKRCQYNVGLLGGSDMSNLGVPFWWLSRQVFHNLALSWGRYVGQDCSRRESNVPRYLLLTIIRIYEHRYPMVPSE